MFWKLNQKIPEHENSTENERTFKQWMIMEMTLNKGKIFGSKLQEQTMKERHIWRQVLTRLLNVRNRTCFSEVIDMCIVPIKVT